MRANKVKIEKKKPTFLVFSYLALFRLNYATHISATFFLEFAVLLSGLMTAEWRNSNSTKVY